MQRSLYSVPTAHADESPLSWLFKTAALHGVSVQKLCAAVQVRRRRSDIDACFHDRFLRRVLHGTGKRSHEVVPMMKLFEPLRRDQWLKIWLRKTATGDPATAYCPECLESDVMPYWRAVWRFRYWVVCPEHLCKMLDRCQACRAEITLESGLDRNSYNQMMRWGACMHCQSVFTGRSFDQPVFIDEARRIGDLQKGVTAALLHGGFFLAGISQKIPISFLPGVLIAGAFRGGTGTTPQWDVRHLKELESAIRYHRKSGYEGLCPRNGVGHYVTSRRLPWVGAAGDLAERVLHARFILPLLLAWPTTGESSLQEKIAEMYRYGEDGLSILGGMMLSSASPFFVESRFHGDES